MQDDSEEQEVVLDDECDDRWQDHDDEELEESDTEDVSDDDVRQVADEPLHGARVRRDEDDEEVRERVDLRDEGEPEYDRRHREHVDVVRGEAGEEDGEDEEVAEQHVAVVP